MFEKLEYTDVLCAGLSFDELVRHGLKCRIRECTVKSQTAVLEARWPNSIVQSHTDRAQGVPDGGIGTDEILLVADTAMDQVSNHSVG